MSARFRIRTPQGQEISFASHEIFAEFVRSGDLHPDDVVYDAETREWAPARTHPVVLQIELEAAEAEGDEATGKERAGEPTEPAAGMEGTAEEVPPTLDLEEIGLDLAPAAEQMTPEEEAAAFVAKMEAERASDLAFEADPGISGLKMAQGSNTIGSLDDIGPVRPEPRARSGDWDRERTWEQKSPKAEPARPSQPKKTGVPARRAAPLLLGAGVIVAAGIYFGTDVLSFAQGTGTEAVPDSLRLPPPPPAPLIPDTEESLRRRAQEVFLGSTQALLRSLPPVPDIWLRGQYLAAPSDYPNVRTVWEQYLATVREVRAGDGERYRAAYLRALEDARVEGSARTLRLSRATEDFRAAGVARAAHWDRVEALALAALRAHDALVRAEGTIRYEPARGPAVSADPVIEAAGRSPEAQALLEDVLDSILAELHGARGPGEAARVRAWVWEGLIAAVAG